MYNNTNNNSHLQYNMGWFEVKLKKKMPFTSIHQLTWIYLKERLNNNNNKSTAVQQI